MGYASTVPYATFELGSSPQQYFDITTAATDVDLSYAITIPTWIRGGIRHAYLDAYLPYVYNNNAALNALNGTQYIKVSVDGGTFDTNAILIRGGSLTCWGNDGIAGTVRLVGNYDIGSVIALATTVNFRWALSKVALNSLSLSNIFFVLRITGD